MGSQFVQPHAQNQTTIIQNSTKKTMGRRKIEIKPIQNKNNLQVTFSKRRGGVFKKAGELSVLCGAEVAIIVRSPANKVYTFGNPDVDAVLHRFETGSSSQVTESIASSSTKKAYVESIRRLEKEKKRCSKELHEPYGVNWWDMGFEGMELYELDEYSAALEILKSNVLKKVDEIEKKKVGLEFGSNLEVDFESEVVGKYDDWQALLYEDQFINAEESNSWMFGG